MQHRWRRACQRVGWSSCLVSSATVRDAFAPLRLGAIATGCHSHCAVLISAAYAGAVQAAYGKQLPFPLSFFLPWSQQRSVCRKFDGVKASQVGGVWCDAVCCCMLCLCLPACMLLWRWLC